MRENISILVVDDEEMMRNLLKKILAKEGYKIEVANDGLDALEKLRVSEFDMMISDIQMPRLNGFELLQKVKKEYPSMSVVIMTAYGDSFTVKDALLLGADEYVTKPFKSFEINLIVERAYWRMKSNQSEKGVKSEACK